MTVDEATKALCKLASDAAGMGALCSKDGLATAADRAKQQWRYSITRGANMTPTIDVNGVRVSDGVVWSYEEWETFLDKLLA